jgi:uncharacterized membrane protein
MREAETRTLVMQGDATFAAAPEGTWWSWLPRLVLPRQRQTWLVLLCIAVAWAVFSWALLARHGAYYSAAYDLGFFDQIIWNTAHGRWFATTFLSYSFAGQHMEPVLLLYAAIYRLLPRAEVLLLTEAALAAWSAFPLYLGARRALASSTAGLLVAAAYLLSPQLHGAVLFDFHPELLGIAGIFAAFALIVADRPGLALLSLGSIFILKEDATLVGAGFALLFWLRGYRWHGVVLLCFAAMYALIVLGILMPHLRGGVPSDLQERYGYLGTTPAGIILGALRHPGRVVARLAGTNQRRALGYLAVTLALLPLATPVVLAAVPELALNLLVTHPDQQSLTLHYVSFSLALLFIAAVLGTENLVRSPRFSSLWRRLPVPPTRRAVVVASALLVAEVAGWLLGSPLGLRFQPSHFAQTAHTHAVAQILAEVPGGVSVSAQSGLLPHLSQRREIWEFPLHAGAGESPLAAVVVVDQHGWVASQSRGAGYDEVLASLPSRGYCLKDQDDGVLFYVRGSGATCASMGSG